MGCNCCFSAETVLPNCWVSASEKRVLRCTSYQRTIGAGDGEPQAESHRCRTHCTSTQKCHDRLDLRESARAEIRIMVRVQSHQIRLSAGLTGRCSEDGVGTGRVAVCRVSTPVTERILITLPLLGCSQRNQIISFVCERPVAFVRGLAYRRVARPFPKSDSERERAAKTSLRSEQNHSSSRTIFS